MTINSRDRALTQCRLGSGNEHGRLIRLFVTWIIGVNLIALLIVAVWFRCRSLENIPGLNGDEAWYGVQAVQILHGSPISWQTPTGNLLNPFFIGPLTLLHLWFQPSIALLRTLAVASGLKALVINWILCRLIFDRRMAWISTAVLAVLPIAIAYSRIAWDASQSMAATLPVVYFSLGAIRFPRWCWQLISAAVACQVIAVVVHPTNVFAATAIAAALVAQWKPSDAGSSAGQQVRRLSAMVVVFSLGVLIGLLSLGFLTGIWIFGLMHTPMPKLLEAHLVDSLNSSNMLQAIILFPRLFIGGTVYRYVAGSHSWFEWPLALNREGFGIDVLVFWILILAAWLVLWRSWKRAGRLEDGVLIAAWVLAMAVFLLLAGPRAMAPGQERFAIGLIGLTVIFLCRAASLAMTRISWTSGLALTAAVALGWAMLADFHVHYFRFIEKTGGQAHRTFRTAAEEPKAAALKYVLQHRANGETWIITSEWWNLWPLRYLSSAESNICVFTPQEASNRADAFAIATKEARVWFVEFSNSKALLELEAKSADSRLEQHHIKDYAGQPILTIAHPQAKDAIRH